MKKNMIKFVLVPVLMIITAFFGMTMYLNSSITRTQKHIYNILQDSAKEQIATLNATVDGQFAVLESFASAIAEQGSLAKYDDVVRRMNGIAKKSNFYFIGITDAQGHGYINDGHAVTIDNRQYFQRAIAGENAMEKLMRGRVYNDVCFIIATPIVQEEKIVGVVFGSYDEDAFSAMLMSRAFSDSGYSYVCDSHGNIIAGSKNAAYLMQSPNVLRTLENAKFKKGFSCAKLAQDLEKQIPGIISVSLYGEQRYGVYQPLNRNDWMLFNVVPGAVVDVELQRVTQSGLMLMAFILVMAVLIIIFIIMLSFRQAKRLELERDKTRINEARFKLALQTTSISIWDYNLKTKCIIQAEESLNQHNFAPIIYNVPDSLIANGFVHPDSVSEFVAMHNKLLNGEKTAEGIFMIQKKDQGGYLYEHIRYINIFDEKGLPYKAIGISEDVTENVEAHQQYKIELQMRKTMSQDVYASEVINISKRCLEDYFTNENVADLQMDNIDNLFVNAAAMVVNNERIRLELLALNVDLLAESYQNGRKSLSFEYLRSNADGEGKWVALEMHLLCKPDNNDLYAFIYLRDIDKYKRMLADLEHKAQTDSLTGLFNIMTAKDLVNNYLQGIGKSQLNAFFIIDLDNFKNINDSLSHFEGDRVLIHVSTELSAIFLRTDIVARIGGDEFIVFLKNVPSQSFIVNKAHCLCEALQFTVGSDNEIMVSCSIGIAVCENGNKDFDTLYKEADVALYNAKKQGKKRYVMLPASQHFVTGNGDDIAKL